MSTEVEPSEWTSLDPWWSAYAQTRLIARSSASAPVFGKERLTDCWDELDQWWRAYIDTSPHVHHPDSTRTLVTKRLTGSWEELDPWWDIYTETGHDTTVEIAHLLDQSNEEWRQSAAPFDTDPLASALTKELGPLLPSNEEEWSDWLAKLLRPSEVLVTELFDLEVNQAPDEIVREDKLSKEGGGFRRPDVLLFHADHAISIEVKLDDKHYGKTAETARLVEEQYDDYVWIHVLLLPERKKERLRAIVQPPVESRSGGQLYVEWDTPGPVSVIYWRDVTEAIRTLLRRGEAVNDQWAASAYLFCAAAEQQIMGFQPQPVVERLAAPTNVVDTIQPIRLADTLEEQLTYLRAGLDP